MWFKSPVIMESKNFHQVHNCVRDLSEISSGEVGGWKTGEVHSFLSPSKGRVMKKMTGKQGGSQEIKPP